MGLPQLNAPSLDANTSSAIERYVRSTAATLVQFAADRATLSTLTTGTPAYFDGNEWEFDSSNLSTLVTADPRQALFVAPISDTTGASGAWVRKYSGWANGLWWGATPGVGDTSAAVVAAVATMYALRFSSGVWSYGSGGSGALYYPASRYGAYNCGTTRIDVSHMLRILGDSSGDPNGGGTVFKWDNGAGGFKFLTGAQGALIDGFTLVGGFTTTEGEYHALETDVVMKVRDCYAINWSGDALYENNDSAGGTGSSNGFEVDRFYAENCRNAHNAAGGDVNAGRISGLQTKRCRRWAVMQTGFLGQFYEGCSVNANALTSFNTGAAGHPVSYCTQGGFRYFVIHGQEAWASANAPTGAATSNQGWGYWTAGGVATGIPAWFAGIEVRSGGAYLVSGLNNRSGFYNCYSEDNNVSQFDQLVSRFEPFMNYAFYVSAGVLWGAAAEFGNARIVTTSDVESVMHGLRVAKGVGTTVNILEVHNSQTALATGVAARLAWAFAYEADGITPCYVACISAHSSTNNAGTNGGRIVFSTRTVGGAGAQTDQMVLDGPALTHRCNVDNGLDHGTAAIRWGTDYCYTLNAATAITTAGSIAAATTIKSSGATSGIGYATGAGGTVTQLTSKATSVQVDKVCGAITTHNAALAANTTVTFTVTDSAVAATDAIILTLKSGNATAGTYEIWPEAVAAGSFKINVRNISAGSLSEALVINFAVIKAVAS